MARVRSISFATLVLLAASLLETAPEGLPASGPSTGQASDAQELIRDHHWKRARGILEPAIKAHPDDAKGCYLLSLVELAFNNVDGALPLAEHAVNLDGRNSEYDLQLGKVYGEMASRASFLSAGSLASKFRKHVERAIEIDPKNVDALDALMQFKYVAPAIMDGSKEEAHALADRIAALNPSEGYLSHAELSELAKNSSEQEAYLLKAVNADPRNYGAATELAKFYSQPEHPKYEASARYAGVAVGLDPGRIDGYWIYAKVLAVRELWTDLERELALAGKNVPDDLRPYYEAAYAVYLSGKNLQRAEGYARKYLTQEPEGEEPDAADGHLLLGLILESQGRKPEARAEMELALRLRPGLKAAKDDLKRLGY